MFDNVPGADRWEIISDRYRPAQSVWVDLGMVFPLRERPDRFYPDALDLQAQVPGELHMRALTTTGMQVAYVTFPMKARQGGFRTTQWVVARAVQPLWTCQTGGQVIRDRPMSARENGR
jgi:hypothetical protein